jgi:hypothetical protein
MVCEHKYLLVSFFNHYGFLPDHTGECVDPVAEERIEF